MHLQYGTKASVCETFLQSFKHSRSKNPQPSLDRQKPPHSLRMHVQQRQKTYHLYTAACVARQQTWCSSKTILQSHMLLCRADLLPLLKKLPSPNKAHLLYHILSTHVQRHNSNPHCALKWEKMLKIFKLQDQIFSLVRLVPFSTISSRVRGG
jgi:hypothetical protein